MSDDDDLICGLVLVMLSIIPHHERWLILSGLEEEEQAHAPTYWPSATAGQAPDIGLLMENYWPHNPTWIKKLFKFFIL